MDETKKGCMVGVVLTEKESDEYEFIFKGHSIITYSNILYVIVEYKPEEDEVKTWFSGTNNIEKVIYG